MAKLLSGRFNRFAEKLFATKEGRSTLDTISPEIQITGSILNGVEDRYLLAWNRYAQDFTQAALAANFSIGEIRNPKASQVIVVIESMIFRNATAGNVAVVWVISAANTDQGTVSTGQVIRLDPRGGPTPSAILSVGTSAAAPVGANMTIGLVQATSFQIISNPEQELTVLPGDALFVFGQVVNQGVTCSIGWRERVLESSELS